MSNMDTSNVWMNEIIDELHPHFKHITDEELVESYEDRGVFERTFSHNSGKDFKLRWTVYYGTPETVVTVFEDMVLVE